MLEEVLQLIHKVIELRSITRQVRRLPPSMN